MRARTLVGLLLALGLVGFCVWYFAPAAPPSAEQLVLLRRVQTLRALAARAQDGLIAPGDALVVVDQHLLQDLLSSVLPIDGELGGYSVRLESAVTQFEDGLALVRLEARAAAPKKGDAGASFSLLAGIDQVDLAAGSGELRARLTVFAVDAAQLRAAGRGSRLAGLARALGPTGVEAIASWLPALPLPLSFSGQVELPALDSEFVRIPAAKLPVSIAVRDVAVFGGRLWVSLAEGQGGSAPGLQALLRPGDVKAAPAPGVFGAASRGCSRHRRDADAVAAEDLRRSYEQERARLTAALARDSLVHHVLSDPSEVTVVLRTAFVEALVGRAMQTYLRDVQVDLAGKRVRKTGDERRKTPIGTRQVGSWTLLASLDGVRGTVHAGQPRIQLLRGNQLRLQLPVRVGATPASVNVHFAWDSQGLGKLACRDFQLQQRISGTVAAAEETLKGGLELSSDASGLLARPFFEQRELRLHATASAASWKAVHEALEGQNTLFRCGLGLDPDAVVAKLHQLVAEGFRVKLPLELRPVRLPARFSDSVVVGTTRVVLLVRPGQAEVTEHGLWARARVHAVRQGSLPAGDDADAFFR